MTVSDDDDAAAAAPQKQLGRDTQLALAIQVEENIEYARAAALHTVPNDAHEASSSMTGASMDDDSSMLVDEYATPSLSAKEKGLDEFEEVSSVSVARAASLSEREEEDEFLLVHVSDKFSDLSSAVAVSEEEKKSGSPVLISGEDTSSYDVLSSDFSSPYTYAAKATAALDEADHDVIADGIGVIPSVTHLRPESVASGTASLSETTETVAPRGIRRGYFYDILHPERGDPVFQALFGQYDDALPLLLNITSPNGKAANVDLLHTNPTALSLAARNASLGPSRGDTPKLQFEQYCECTFGTTDKPEYRLMTMTGPLHGRIFEIVVQHPLIDTVFVGTGKGQLDSENDAARKALEALWTGKEISERAKKLTISFRAAASRLPFCLRFQLERSMHLDSWLKMKKRPKDCDATEIEQRKLDLIFRARKLMIVYLQVVLPPLLAIDWTVECGGDNCFTLIELFASEIWDSLVAVKEAVKRGRGIDFSASTVQQALDRAQTSLRHAENVCGGSEAQLSAPLNGRYIETVRKRSLWPVGTYSCKFDLGGVLVPTDMQVLNKDVPKNKFVQPQTRRVMREVGWPVRDRFIHMSSVKFHETFKDNLADWVQNAKLCGREYVYLLDKGTGKPSIWLYSSPTEGPYVDLSRDALLESLGCFDGIAATKLGDRISLAFTQTTPIDEIPMGCIVAEPELVTNGYRFSDGCGVMGKAIAKKAQEVLMLREMPGAIQIRIGGVKGMLSFKHDYPENKIGLRPSMVKFPSKHRILEVKQVAVVTRSPPLFSQLLLVMHHQKVPNRILLRLQAEACATMAQKCDDSVGDGGIDDPVEYARKVVKHGRKHSGEALSEENFELLTSMMKDARNNVNLKCAVSMMFGVIDEHGILEEGQVLVGNGSIKGPVLISRSPCLMPGDIQKAHAVVRQERFAETYSRMKNVIVFSAKGQRPLADKLGGGDLDGDQYYVISEKDLVEHTQSVDAHDYGSQADDVAISVRINVQESFSVSALARAPDLSNQINVLRKLLALGDIVSLSSDAWIRVADVEGAASAQSLRLANLCQHALDARKLAFQISQDQLNQVNRILKDRASPHWKGGPRHSNSILGILFEKWDQMISDLEAARGRRSPRYNVPNIPTEIEAHVEADADTVVSTESRCIICSDTGVMTCFLCGVTVSLCSDECKIMHESEAGHTRGSGGSEPASSLDSFQESAETFSLEASALETLLKVTFDRDPPSVVGARRVNFRCLTEADLKVLRNMVLAEYYKSLKDNIEEDSTRSNDVPHEYDVFLLDSGDLAVCRRDSCGNLVWEDKGKNQMDLEETLYNRRVASLSGPCRVLDSLMVKPASGSLMEQAMKRDVVAVTAVSQGTLPNSVVAEFLNTSQQRVVEAALSMKSGLLAVQGPPGCGKTSTIVEIVSAIGSGVLVCAPSNAAVANLARRLVSTGSFSSKEVVVWGENCDESVHFLNPILRHQRWESFFKSYNKSENDAEKRRKLLDFALWLQVDVKQPRLLTAVMKEARLDADNSSGLESIASAKVLLCTLNTAGSHKLRKASKFKFSSILLDEASQAPEAEFYILTTFPGAKRIIVVGDPKQLPATVADEGLRDAGYAQSFLSHVLKYHPEKVHLLDVQYRMDPDILRFSNEVFYSNRVASDVSVMHRQPTVSSPFLVIDTSGIGTDVETEEWSSWKNECEAVVIKSILCNDKDIRRVRSEVVGARTIVITPYKAQMRYLRRELKKIKSFRSLDIATVDSFQGQEGDIVIVSTVRTKSVGFVDSPNRLNVALTRAKRVLRVVGNMEFFARIPGQQSTLRKLAGFAEQNNLNRTTTIAVAWRPTDWKAVKTAWKPTMTSRFHDCLKDRRRMDRNVAFNTLLAVSTPRLSELTHWPVEKGPPRWQTSSLHKYDRIIQVVWIAKEFEHDGRLESEAPYVGVVEAHFAGSPEKCLSFKQKNHIVPRNACIVKRDMSGIVRSSEASEDAIYSTNNIELSWEVTNNLQDAVVDDEIQELPVGLFLLDEYQESIITLSPPLLLESRSGMGKTEILFKHCISYPPSAAASRTCFVTVSANLCRALQRRYDDVHEFAKAALPRVSFYSFLGSRVHSESGTERVQSFVDLLLGIYRIADMSVSSACAFLDFVQERTSHEKLEVDPALVESEIGGVILGSLAAALKGEPLSRAEYLEEIRSNVPNDSTDGARTRNLVYDAYEKYRIWKLARDEAYDTNDIVLRLICESNLQGDKEIFQSAYLDEVQDFSYASLFLICSIAGKTEARWTAAGDTAQMISPGCSFKFKGMKQTLLAIRDDITLRKEVKLKRNYRMNRGTLEMANAIIKVIKRNFPKAIESYQEEEAMKDLGLNVVLLDWNRALAAKDPAFGPQQAVVYSSDRNLEAINESMNRWLNNHPFILSSLDSKGLEFDDVVVAFKFERKTWDVDAKRTASLRMCRELYVAVTRARRRVVVLVENIDTMLNFFESLDCDLEITDPEVILQEFQKETSREEWFAKGEQMFAEEQYKYAASCFNAALDFGWSSYAQGCHLLAMRRRNEAGAFFRIAAKNFFEEGMFEKCLDSFKQLISAETAWDDADNAIFDAALKKRPDHLDRKEMVAFALLRGSWDTIKFGDLTAYSSVFQSHRDDANLKAMIEKCSEDERSVVEESLPLVVGDFHVDGGRLAKATELFLRGGDEEAAMAATEAAISSTHHDLPRVAATWRRDEKARSKIPEDRAAISLLVSLFESPKDAAMNHANACMKSLGRSIVKLAIESAEDAGVEELYAFSRTGFEIDILDALTERYGDNRIDVVHWYRERNDKERALAFATSNMKTLSNEDLLGIILKDKELRPRDLLAELTVRKVLVEASKACLSSDSFDLDFAKKASDKALSSVKLASENADEVLKVWNSRRNDGRVARFLSNEVGSSSAALLWLLFDDPQTAGRRFGKKCMRVFGKDVVRKAVLKKKGSDANGAYSVLRLFDKTKFEADKPTPQAKRGPAKSKSGPSTPKGKLDTRATKPADEDELKVGDRIVVTGLTKKSNLYLNGQPGKIVKITDKGSYIVILDFDKPDKKGNVQKRKLDRQKLKREEVENSDSSDDSGPPSLMQRGRDGHNNDDDSTSSSDSSAAVRPRSSRGSGEKKSVPSTRMPSSKNDDSDESSMPSLFQEGSNSSSDDDSDAPNDKVGGDDGSDTESMPELESKASSEESTDSDGAFPRGRQAAVTKKKNDSSVPSHVRTGKVQDVSSDESSDDSSVPPLQKRASPRGQDDSSDSTLSDVPLLLSGENSSDDSSVPELEEPRLSRNDSSDDSSEDGGVPMMTKRSRFKQQDISDGSDSDEDLPVPGLEYARGNQSSSEDDSSSGSSKAPVLVSRPPEEDSSDGDSSPSDDDVPDLMDRDGSISTPQSRAQGQSQQPASRNAPARKKQKGKNKRKGRRGKGGKK